MRQAATVPADHMARVQYVMGRAIVNFTARGIRSGVLSADQYLSEYNTNMIRVTEAWGQRLDQEFASTWQATLGHGIVNAIQHYTERAGAIQERVGTALVHMVQAQTGSEEVRGAQQKQLASLVVAAIRTEALADRLTLLAAIESFPEDTAVASLSWRPGLNSNGLPDCCRPHAGDRLLWRTFADCSEQRNQSTRREGTPGSQVGVSPGGVKACEKRTRVIHTRASDLCHGYIGES